MTSLGGGCRTEASTLPGFAHDPCATVLALAEASPFLSGAISELGVELCAPPIALAHPLDGLAPAALHRDVEVTVASLGADGPAYRDVVAPLLADGGALFETILSPMRSVPRHPLRLASLGWHGLPSAAWLARRFSTPQARALVAGVAAHATLPLTSPLTAAYAITLLASAHLGGWPVVRGGIGALTAAIADELRRLGARVVTDAPVATLDELAASRVVLLDVAPEELPSLTKGRLGRRRTRAVGCFERAVGACKVDWALSGPVPWRDEACRRAGTVHLGGTFDEVAVAEATAPEALSEPPFCIVVQATIADPSRAPAGAHTLWGYCHVPLGSDLDATEAIERQLERFAPGFSAVVLARTTTTAAALATANRNEVGGDVGGGSPTLQQTVARPWASWHPYRTGLRGVWLCSASTPPGAGVHGMCGVHAALDALSWLSRR